MIDEKLFALMKERGQQAANSQDPEKARLGLFIVMLIREVEGLTADVRPGE